MYGVKDNSTDAVFFRFEFYHDAEAYVDEWRAKGCRDLEVVEL